MVNYIVETITKLARNPNLRRCIDCRREFTGKTSKEKICKDCERNRDRASHAWNRGNKHRKCRVCETVFESQDKADWYCSEECLDTYNKNDPPELFIPCQTIASKPDNAPNPSKVKSDKPPRLCDRCNRDFSPKSPNHRYCSMSCRLADVKTEIGRGRLIILERDDFRCIYCGRDSIKHGVVLHIDHIIASNQGGTNRAENLVTACEECNVQKSDRSIDHAKRIQMEVHRRNIFYGVDPEQIIKL